MKPSHETTAFLTITRVENNLIRGCLVRRVFIAGDCFFQTMNFSQDWKSLFSANSVFNAPRLLQSASLGPLIFNPCPETLTPLFSSPSLSPLPELSTTASRVSSSAFLSASDDSSFLPPTLAASISKSLSPEDNIVNRPELNHNRLQLLHCPGNKSAFLFFPVGENFDQVGFLKLIVENGKLSAASVVDNMPFVGKKKFDHRIVKMLVNPVEDLPMLKYTREKMKPAAEKCIGYLMVFTLYSVHWFGIKLKLRGSGGLDSEKSSCLYYLGGKVFKTCAVADAAWSPHLQDESVVLLENGEAFLFDLEGVCGFSKNTSCSIAAAKFKGKRIDALCKELGEDSGQCVKWFCCVFAWHPRILIAANEDAVFLLDLRSKEKNVVCLARIEALNLNNSMVEEKDKFVALARAAAEGLDGFHFAVASNSVLALFDVRKPLWPVLLWDHNLDKPTYVEVYRLSELRSGLNNDDWATKSGSCIVLGSFWNNEFSVFCYGPLEQSSFYSKLSEVSSSIYAWELPSELLLTGCDCGCGSCIISNEFLKEDLPEWVDWQQKKEITLGFGVINSSMSSLLSECNEFNGFTLVRLLSSGELESQRYCGSWKLLVKAHEECSKHFGDNLVVPAALEEFRFPRRFEHLKLNLLHAHLTGDLDRVLTSNQKPPFVSHLDSNMDSCSNKVEILSKAFGLGVPKPITEFLRDVSSPASIHEMAMWRMWAGLPSNLLSLAFSNYSELLHGGIDEKVASLEFLPVPKQSESEESQEFPVCPFFNRPSSARNNKWSSTVRRTSDLVGPVRPLPVLVSLQKASMATRLHGNQGDGYSYENELTKLCCEVKNTAQKMAVTISSTCSPSEIPNSLSNNREDIKEFSQASTSSEARSLFMYSCGSRVEGCPDNLDFSDQNGAESTDDRYTTFISKICDEGSSSKLSPGKDSSEQLCSDLCPIELKFNVPEEVGDDSLPAFSMLKKQLSKWRAGLHQEFRRKS